MEYTLETHQNAEIYSVKVSGNVELKEATSLMQEVITAAYTEKKKYLFCDLTELTGSFKPMERYEFAAGVASMYPELVQKFKYGIKIALCGKEPLVAPDRLGEIVAQNRFLNVKVFTSELDALEWLIGQ